jgi:hypothetical protein
LRAYIFVNADRRKTKRTQKGLKWNSDRVFFMDTNRCRINLNIAHEVPNNVMRHGNTDASKLGDASHKFRNLIWARDVPAYILNFMCISGEETMAEIQRSMLAHGRTH